MNAEPVEIRPMRDTDGWEELTELLREAYREHLLGGRDYTACTQTPEKTRQRCAGGTTLLAFAGGHLVGTATIHEQRRHGRAPGGYISQIAVSPDFRKSGIGRRLLSELERIAGERHWSILDCNTAETAEALVA